MIMSNTFEQQEALLRDFSKLLSYYRGQLESQGFDKKEAFELVREYQQLTFNTTKR